jgi:prepilin-type N-terminal cleavage/methylation domain-containing protein
MRKGFTLIELLVALGFIASIAFTGFLIYVAWHFIAKFW